MNWILMNKGYLNYVKGKYSINCYVLSIQGIFMKKEADGNYKEYNFESHDKLRRKDFYLNITKHLFSIAGDSLMVIALDLVGGQEKSTCKNAY